MFLPYGTDAPVYHYPVATIGIIATNTALFLLTGMGDCGGYDWLILEFDQINPLQWVTSAFMHGSWSHLIGNMIFLWCFGLIIEGKLGWHKFGLLYLGLALADGAIGQIPMYLFTDGAGGALGASGVIFALLAVAVIWAPENDIHFFYVWNWLFHGTIDVPISVVAFFYFAVEFLQVTWTGFSMSTPMLHLLGMSVGIPFAIFMLKHGLVDCEGWDLFSRLGIGPLSTKDDALPRGSKGLPLFQTAPYRAVDQLRLGGILPPSTAAARNQRYKEGGSGLPLGRQTNGESTRPKRNACASAFESFARAIRANRIEQAVTCFDRLRENSCVAAVPDSTLVAYINLLSKTDRHTERLLPLRFLASRSSKYANNARLQIAVIELRHNCDPQSAIKILENMRLPLTEKLASVRKRLLREANARLRERQQGETEPTR
ncbi:rhomboid family intramembrane serine protease [Aporhodopirellula aestuarii]|uniref:Rhomboid family intramembrane serine protease n=1 Tax=Aporhodopirellula aestuarii TaxID=2950107 RepID=A0ABT0TY97_9BACT|nr:rhomboid family intramembrane serine protease [Aporhodopirellula aestuarii]MCM2369505.1 rhomboid family intramembrane serine protease [Aporhodopirellula aestuarii]